MKFYLSKAEYEALDDSQKAYYKAAADGRYKLSLADDDRDEQVSHLTQKKSIAEEHRSNAERRVQELTAKVEELTAKIEKGNDDTHRKNGDVDALDKSWTAKFDKQKAEYEGTIASLNQSLTELLVTGVAQRMAAEISTAPDLLAPVIAKRLRVEQVDGKHVTKVIDDAGNLSALTIEDLRKEIAGKKEYASVIIAGKGSGGGSRGGQQRGGASDKKFSELSDEERMEWHRRDPDGFKRAVAESKSNGISI
ncbi:head scaffolding protein [Achromobacter phage 83-24]|uniref:Scaffold protein n=1 Tax=Achromobacter phage 83-24 TaxID=1589747 RepID=A0A0B5A6S3_9CAUD|nr:head scaffolding protein [Achromobacter phage 83-24]AJD82841.1 hypothetical protein JWAP_00008 [Achromobacter phage 83-24]